MAGKLDDDYDGGADVGFERLRGRRELCVTTWVDLKPYRYSVACQKVTSNIPGQLHLHPSAMLSEHRIGSQGTSTRPFHESELEEPVPSSGVPQVLSAQPHCPPESLAWCSLQRGKRLRGRINVCQIIRTVYPVGTTWLDKQTRYATGPRIRDQYWITLG